MHRARLSRAVRIRLGADARGWIEREDLVQETLRKAMLSLDRFHWRGQGAFLAWLVQISTHTLQDMLRREGAAPVERLDDSRAERLAELARDSRTPGTDAAHSEEQAALDRALTQLNEEERDAVVRRKILGQDYPSLAEDLGLTAGAARMRVSRAMVELTRWAQRHG